jgi:hypothetical protein
MSTPSRRRLVLAITSLGFGLTLGCSASETTNTVDKTATGGAAPSSTTGGTSGTAGSGSKATGGAKAGGSSNAGGQTTASTNPCSTGMTCTGIGQCHTPDPPLTVCQCNGGKYSCT